MPTWPRQSKIILRLFLFAIIALLAIPNVARAQAWVAPVGSGSISISSQGIDNTGHFLTDGTFRARGQSLDISLYIEGEYSLTDRLSFTVGLPYVFAKYSTAIPLSLPLPTLPVDLCHCWHGGWQDWNFTARYNLVRASKGAFSLTPSISGGVPSHNYDFRGEAVLGRDLKEVRVGVDVGQRLDKVSPNLIVEGHYSYAFVERVIDIGSNRSNMSLGATYLLLKRRLAVRGFAAWQHTYDGLRLGSPAPSSLVFPGDINTPERLAEHDRLLQDNNFRPGGGFSYSFPRVDAFASYTAYVSGANSHAGRALTLGVSWPFEFGGVHRR